MLFCHQLFFFKISFFEKFFQEYHQSTKQFVGPGLGPNCYQQTTPVGRVILIIFLFLFFFIVIFFVHAWGVYLQLLLETMTFGYIMLKHEVDTIMID